MKKSKKTNIKKQILYLFAGGLLVLAVLCLVFSVMSFIHSHKNKSNNQTGELIDYSKIQITRPELQVHLLTPNKNSRPQIALNNIRGVVIHYTANPGSDAMANRDYFESRKDEADKLENKVSSHFIIGLKGQIVQCIPLSEEAHASNDRNDDTVSIECCHPDASGKFNKKTYHALLHLTAWLCMKYHLTKDDLIRHYDVTGKICPKYYVEHPRAWKTFKQDVWDKLKKHLRED